MKSRAAFAIFLNMRFRSILTCAVLLANIACTKPNPYPADEVGAASTDTTETGEPDPFERSCWILDGYSWCTVAYHNVLVETPCESIAGTEASVTWTFGCALDEPIDLTGWDAAWCNGNDCWGVRDGYTLGIVPKCIVDAVTEPATKWPDGCAEGELLPFDGVWDEWRCGEHTCAARVGAVWVFVAHACNASEWNICD